MFATLIAMVIAHKTAVLIAAAVSSSAYLANLVLLHKNKGTAIKEFSKPVLITTIVLGVIGAPVAFMALPFIGIFLLGKKLFAKKDADTTAA